MFNKAILPALLISCLGMFLLAACGNKPAPGPKVDEAEAMPRDNSQSQNRPIALSGAQEKAPVKIQSKTAGAASPDLPVAEASKDEALTEVDWGGEITLDEIIEMAKSGRIREIEWHVMPNIIRVLTSDGGIFHLKNENKGVDIRNTLINAGVKIGKGGMEFRHVF